MSLIFPGKNAWTSNPVSPKTGQMTTTSGKQGEDWQWSNPNQAPGQQQQQQPAAPKAAGGLDLSAYSPGKAQPIQPQSQGTPFQPYTNSSGQAFTGTQSYAPGTSEQYQNQAYGGWANNQGYSQPQVNQYFNSPAGNMANDPFANRPPPFSQSATGIDGRQFADPLQAANQRDALIQRINESRAPMFAGAGVYPGNDTPPPTWGQKQAPDFNTLMGQANQMVDNGWTNPFAPQFSIPGARPMNGGDNYGPGNSDPYERAPALMVPRVEGGLHTYRYPDGTQMAMGRPMSSAQEREMWDEHGAAQLVLPPRQQDAQVMITQPSQEDWISGHGGPTTYSFQPRMGQAQPIQPPPQGNRLGEPPAEPIMDPRIARRQNQMSGAPDERGPAEFYAPPPPPKPQPPAEPDYNAARAKYRAADEVLRHGYDPTNPAHVQAMKDRRENAETLTSGNDARAQQQEKDRQSLSRDSYLNRYVAGGASAQRGREAEALQQWKRWQQPAAPTRPPAAANPEDGRFQEWLSRTPGYVQNDSTKPQLRELYRYQQDPLDALRRAGFRI